MRAACGGAGGGTARRKFGGHDVGVGHEARAVLESIAPTTPVKAVSINEN